MTHHVGVGTVWKETEDLHIGVVGTWERVVNAYVGVGGNWKEFYTFTVAQAAAAPRNRRSGR